MIIDGKEIASDILREVKKDVLSLSRVPRLTIFTCAPQGETLRYLQMKIRRGREVGIDVNVIELTADLGTAEICRAIGVEADKTDSIIVQLPLPTSIDTDAVLQTIPRTKDVDVVHYPDGAAEILPPVVGAIAEILRRNNLSLTGKEVVVVGNGRLVGKPATQWAGDAGASVAVIHKDTERPEEILKAADIIISGAGVPGLITPEQLREGVVIFDAGTSEDGGVLKGDVNPAVADKASLFTPVPGGIGPITLAILFKNLVTLAKLNQV